MGLADSELISANYTSLTPDQTNQFQKFVCNNSFFTYQEVDESSKFTNVVDWFRDITEFNGSCIF